MAVGLPGGDIRVRFRGREHANLTPLLQLIKMRVAGHEPSPSSDGQDRKGTITFFRLLVLPYSDVLNRWARIQRRIGLPSFDPAVNDQCLYEQLHHLWMERIALTLVATQIVN
ncbi:MAG: hypothetical protein HYX89_05145 [Chloroflexi bacterium]|nr:hypothetical protein [Chloroflexota bacterium]